MTDFVVRWSRSGSVPFSPIICSALFHQADFPISLTSCRQSFFHASGGSGSRLVVGASGAELIMGGGLCSRRIGRGISPVLANRQGNRCSLGCFFNLLSLR